MASDAINSYVVERIRQHRIEQGLTVVQAVLGVEIESLWPSPTKKAKRVTDCYVLKAVETARKRLPERITYDDILQKVCEVYGVTMEQLASPSRKRDLSEARTVALALVKEQRHLTLVGLSRLLNRDGSSLSHCLRRLKPRLEYDSQLGERISQARQELRNIAGSTGSAVKL